MQYILQTWMMNGFPLILTNNYNTNVIKKLSPSINLMGRPWIELARFSPKILQARLLSRSQPWCWPNRSHQSARGVQLQIHDLCRLPRKPRLIAPGSQPTFVLTPTQWPTSSTHGLIIKPNRKPWYKFLFALTPFWMGQQAGTSVRAYRGFRVPNKQIYLL